MSAAPIHTRSSEKGFTLVELSIVLVIIGLIVGGVLVGQDLIKAAEIRATITQIEKYNTAVNTFRSKYNAIPGDIYNASSIWTAAPENINGDGNGLLSDTNNAATIAATTGEIRRFWRHLTVSNLIEGNFDGDGAVAGTLGTSFPRSKLGRNGIIAYGVAADGFNYYQIGFLSSTAAGVITLADSVTTNEANNIDTKVDDGTATTGVVRAVGTTTTLNGAATGSAGAAAAADCVNTTTNGYALNNTGVNCQLRFRFN